MSGQKIHSVDSVIQTSHIPEAPEAEKELDFEEIEREVGKLLILVYRDRRNVYHAQSQKLRDAYKAQIKVAADSYRNITPVIFATASCMLEACTVLVIAVPQFGPECQSMFNLRTGRDFDCLGLNGRCFATLPAAEKCKITDTLTKYLGLADQIVQQVKGVSDLRDQGRRIEAQAEMQHMQSLSESRGQEHQKYTQEEGDAVRTFEQRRNKREDFELGMAR